jgi:hypothetical protein
MTEPASRPVSKVLEQLIVLAGDMLPAITAKRPWLFEPSVLPELRREIAALVARPCEGERLIDDSSLMLITALKHLVGAKARQAEKWAAIAEALLDQVRGDAALALEQEHGVIRSEAQR